MGSLEGIMDLNFAEFDRGGSPESEPAAPPAEDMLLSDDKGKLVGVSSPSPKR